MASPSGSVESSAEKHPKQVQRQPVAARNPDRSVLAVVVARDRPRGSKPFLTQVLRSVCAQTVQPERVLVVDVSDGSATEALSDVWGKTCAALDGTSDPNLSDTGLGDTGPGDTGFSGAGPILEKVDAPNATNFGEAISFGLEEAGRPTPSWYWLLHDDMVADEDALAELLSAGVTSTKIAVVGPKQVAYGDRDQLRSLGIEATGSSRRSSLTQVGEIDQGQHDSREDVLAVGTAGMLVSAKAWRKLGGLDPGLGPFGDGLEFGRRAHLAGYRVIVAPEAVIEHAQTNFGHETSGKSSFARRRAEQIYNWVVSLPAWMVLPTLLWLPFLTVGRALVRLSKGEPSLARSEISAYLQSLKMTGKMFAARRRIRDTAVVPRGALASLTADPKDIRSFKRTKRRIESDQKKVQVSFDDGALAQLRTHSLRTAGAFVGLLAFSLLLSFLAFYPYVQGVQGGQWGGLPADWATLRDQAFGGWRLSGSGGSGPTDPLLGVLAVLTAPFALIGVTPATVWTLLLFGALPLAAWGGWAFGGALTRSPVVRFAVGGLWAASPAFWLPLLEGEAAQVVAYLALGPSLAGLIRALHPNVALRAGGANDVVKIKVSDRASWLALAAFSAAVAAAAAPLAAPLLFLVALGLALFAKREGTAWHGEVSNFAPRLWGRLVQALIVGVSSLAFVWPSGFVAAREGGENFWVWLASPTARPSGLTALLGLPDVPPTVTNPELYGQAIREGQFPDLVLNIGLSAAAVTVLWAVLVVLLAWRKNTTYVKPTAFFLVGVAFVALTVAQGVHQVGGLGTPYMFLAFATLFFTAVIPAGYGDYELAAYAHKTSRKVLLERALRRTPAAIAAVVSFFAVGAALIFGPSGPFAQEKVATPSPDVGLETPGAPQSGSTGETKTQDPTQGLPQTSPPALPEASTEAQNETDGQVNVATLVGRPTRFISPAPSPAIPYISIQGQESERRARLLTLDVSKRQVRTGLFRGDGVMLADLSTPLVRPVSTAPSDLADAVARLVVYPSPNAATVLGHFAVDTLLLSSVSPEFESVSHVLDATEGLERVGSVGGGVLWRVRPDGAVPARAQVESGASTLPIESSPLKVKAPVALDEGGTLLLSEVADPGWKATFDGEELEATIPTDGSWRQAFTIPAGSGELTVSYENRYLKWWWGSLIIIGAALLIMAIPWRTRPAALLAVENPEGPRQGTRSAASQDPQTQAPSEDEGEPSEPDTASQPDAGKQVTENQGEATEGGAAK